MLALIYYYLRLRKEEDPVVKYMRSLISQSDKTLQLASNLRMRRSRSQAARSGHDNPFQGSWRGSKAGAGMRPSSVAHSEGGLQRLSLTAIREHEPSNVESDQCGVSVGVASPSKNGHRGSMESVGSAASVASKQHGRSSITSASPSTSSATAAAVKRSDTWSGSASQSHSKSQSRSHSGSDEEVAGEDEEAGNGGFEELESKARPVARPSSIHDSDLWNSARPNPLHRPSWTSRGSVTVAPSKRGSLTSPVTVTNPLKSRLSIVPVPFASMASPFSAPPPKPPGMDEQWSDDDEDNDPAWSGLIAFVVKHNHASCQILAGLHLLRTHCELI
jgi:hypothetical protein